MGGGNVDNSLGFAQWSFLDEDHTKLGNKTSPYTPFSVRRAQPPERGELKTDLAPRGAKRSRVNLSSVDWVQSLMEVR